MSDVEFTPKESIDQSRFEVGFCQLHGYFVAGIKGPNGSRWGCGCPRCKAEQKIKALFGQSMIPKRFESKRFDNYIVKNKGQEKALESCRQFADGLKNDWLTGASLILSGTPGTGKTHLACSVGQEAIRLGKTVLFTSASRMLEDIKCGWTNVGSTVKESINRYAKVDLLILDEIGGFRGISEREKDYLFEVINSRYEAMKPIIVISNLGLIGRDSIASYFEERCFDRLCEQATLVVFDWESFRRIGL